MEITGTFLFIPPIGSQSSGIPSRHELPWLPRDQSTLPIIPNIHNLSAWLNHESNESQTFDNDPSTPGSSTCVIYTRYITVDRRWSNISYHFFRSYTRSLSLSLSLIRIADTLFRIDSRGERQSEQKHSEWKWKDSTLDSRKGGFAHRRL